jgi:hypothetical protein
MFPPVNFEYLLLADGKGRCRFTTRRQQRKDRRHNQ